MRVGRTVAAAAMLLACAGVASAQSLDTDTQTLELSVQQLDALTLSNATVTISVIPNNVLQSFSGGTYDLTTNAGSGATRKIQVKISANETNVTVKVNMQAPGAGGNGDSEGDVTLLTTDSDAITGIFATSVTGRTITYKVQVPPTVTAQTFANKTVTYTTIAE